MASDNTKELTEQSLGDHVVNILKAGINGIPVLGGVVGSLMGDYIPKQKDKRIAEAINFLESKVNSLGEKLDKEYLFSEEFVYIFEKTLRGIMVSYQEYKIYCYKGISTNSLIRKDVSQYEKEYYLYLLDGLTELHLKLLSFLNNPKEYYGLYKLDENRISGMGFGGVIEYTFNGTPLEVVKNCYSDLYKMGFTNTEASIFGTSTAARGLDIIKGRISQVGTKFIEFCTKY